ncbi:hypothetical protein [Dyadobacter luticola]|uniref:Uncharacterized protein n=1 Tax=Dyadobacter luticola TaxID=1979387 RepID=A0A5R9L5H8_9BACT|nr:hypothetical protein [Dyadobacter luticola]TLV03824.1 hypothetical protein FEN17_09590 [Dyadobacter luticola]
MKKSNVFALIELSKFVDALKKDSKATLKDKLKSQSSYFNIIDPKYFSEELAPDWADLQRIANQKGVKRDEDGFMVMNAVRHTVETMSEEECLNFVGKVEKLAEKVKKEFEY